MYGWWRTFEHFSHPNSSPVAVSAELTRVEADARASAGAYRKKRVIGVRNHSDWELAYRVDQQQLHRPNEAQRRKYDTARAGGPRGNLGPVPPLDELFIQSRDLDTAADYGDPGRFDAVGQSLLDELQTLRRASAPGGVRAPYKYVVLRWAIEAARAGRPRLTPFNEVKAELSDMLSPFRIGQTAPDPADPWFALRSSSWWDLAGLPPDGTVSSVRRLDLVGGLAEPAYDMIVSDAGFADAAVRRLELLIEQSIPTRRDQPGEQRVPPTSSVELVDVESFEAEDFEVESVLSSEVRQRREASLQAAYREHLLELGHEVRRHRIETASGQVLLTDLYDVTEDNLIEVKASIDRPTMRLALGQILDYARYVSPTWKTVLVPARPELEIMELFDASGVALIWPEGADFVDE